MTNKIRLIIYKKNSKIIDNCINNMKKIIHQLNSPNNVSDDEFSTLIPRFDYFDSLAKRMLKENDELFNQLY